MQTAFKTDEFAAIHAQFSAESKPLHTVSDEGTGTLANPRGHSVRDSSGKNVFWTRSLADAREHAAFLNAGKTARHVERPFGEKLHHVMFGRKPLRAFSTKKEAMAHLAQYPHGDE